MKQLYKSLTDCENSNPTSAENKKNLLFLSFRGNIKAKSINRFPTFKARLKSCLYGMGTVNQSLCGVHNLLYLSKIHAPLLVSNLTFNNFLTIPFQILFSIFVEESFFWNNATKHDNLVLIISIYKVNEKAISSTLNTWKLLNNWRIKTWNFVLTSVIKIENFPLISVEILLTETTEN